MTEREKMHQGLLYDANYDRELLADRAHCKDLCFTYNQVLPSLATNQETLIRQLFGKEADSFVSRRLSGVTMATTCIS